MRNPLRWSILAPKEEPSEWDRSRISGTPWLGQLTAAQVEAAWQFDSVQLRRLAVGIFWALLSGFAVAHAFGLLLGLIVAAVLAVPLYVRSWLLANRLAESPEAVSIHPKLRRRRRVIMNRVTFAPSPGRPRELFWYRTGVVAFAVLLVGSLVLSAFFGVDWIFRPYREALSSVTQ